jgi:glycosyltransferase involved in cell wall biosynthesis
MASKISAPPNDHHVGLYFANFSAGGIQRVMLTLAEGLAHLGWRVDLILVQGDGPLKTQVPQGCQLFDLKAGQTRNTLFKFSNYLKTEKPAVLLSSQTHLNIVAILARILSGWPGRLLVTEHITLDFSAQYPTSWKDRFFPLLAGIFYRWADQIILVSHGAARHFILATHIPAKLVTVINNPIVTHHPNPQPGPRPDMAWFNNTGPVFLAAGRLTLQKDFVTLLRAFSILKARIPSAKLIILGDGRGRARLEELSLELGLKDSVQFLGFVPNPYEYMEKASVFVLSSRWEGFANVLVEAMACGTPVVSTDCPSGPAEILEDGKYGRLVPVGNPEALAEALIQEYNTPHDSKLLKQRAADFSIERILPQYLEVLLPTKGSPQ